MADLAYKPFQKNISANFRSNIHLYTDHILVYPVTRSELSDVVSQSQNQNSFFSLVHTVYS